MTTKIDDLALSVRASNCCQRAGFLTLEEVHAFGQDNCLRLKNFGRKSLAELKVAMEAHGLDLREFEGNKPQIEAVSSSVAALTAAVVSSYQALDDARRAYERARQGHALAVRRLSDAVTKLGALRD